MEHRKCHICGETVERKKIKVGEVPSILKNGNSIFIRICESCWKKHNLKRKDDDE